MDPVSDLLLCKFQISVPIFSIVLAWLILPSTLYVLRSYPESGGGGEVCLLFTIPLGGGIEQLLRDDSNNVGEGKREKRGQEESEVKVSGTRRFVVRWGGAVELRRTLPSACVRACVCVLQQHSAQSACGCFRSCWYCASFAADTLDVSAYSITCKY